MMFQRKIDAMMDWLKNKNKDPKDEGKISDDFDDNYDPKAEWEAENSMKLEKGDILALMISALLVFGPIILVLILILKWLL